MLRFHNWKILDFWFSLVTLDLIRSPKEGLRLQCDRHLRWGWFLIASCWLWVCVRRSSWPSSQLPWEGGITNSWWCMCTYQAPWTCAVPADLQQLSTVCEHPYKQANAGQVVSKHVQTICLLDWEVLALEVFNIGRGKGGQFGFRCGQVFHDNLPGIPEPGKLVWRREHGICGYRQCNSWAGCHGLSTFMRLAGAVLGLWKPRHLADSCFQEVFPSKDYFVYMMWLISFSTSYIIYI